MRGWFDPPLSEAPKYLATAGIGIAAVAITVGEMFGRSLPGLVHQQGSILSDPWTLVTAILPHADPIHLLFNLVWWWYFGTRIERAWGIPAALAVTLLLAAVSSAAECAIGHSGIGLSGVVYGQCALLWVVQQRVEALRGSVSRRTLELMGAWFVLCIVLTMTGVWNIGNMAHGAGAVAGFLLGKSLVADWRRGAWRAALAATTALAVAGAVLPPAMLWHWMNDKSYLGYVALKEGRDVEAVTLLESAVKEHPGDADTMANLGIAYTRVDRIRDAVEAYKKVVALDGSRRAEFAPTIAILLDHESYAASRRGEWVRAKSIAEEALTWDPSDAWAKEMVNSASEMQSGEPAEIP